MKFSVVVKSYSDKIFFDICTTTRPRTKMMSLQVLTVLVKFTEIICKVNIGYWKSDSIHIK